MSVLKSECWKTTDNEKTTTRRSAGLCHCRLCCVYLSDVLEEGGLVAAELDTLWPRQAATGLHPLLLQRGQASGKDGLP